MSNVEKLDFDSFDNNEALLEAISQELFGKPFSEIKYVMVTNHIHQILLDEDLTRTGLYQWLNVFKGSIKNPRDIHDYNEYDIVQVNMSAQDIHLIHEIRSVLGEDSHTKLVVNNDYTTELWSKSFDHPVFLSEALKKTDLIFGTEYYQSTALAELSERKVFIIPHPADVKRLKKLPKKNTIPVVSTVWRRYDNHSYIPSLAVRNLGVSTRLVGYDKNLDQKNWVTTSLYDVVLSGTDYKEFTNQLAESAVVYDPFTFHSYSRTTVDTAALGIPVVVSNRTQSGVFCYPYTTVDPYDVTTARELIQRLLVDDEFKKLVVDTASERVEAYNHENSRLNYMKSLYESVLAGRVSKPREVVKVKYDYSKDKTKMSTIENVEKNTKKVIKYGRGEKILD